MTSASDNFLCNLIIVHYWAIHPVCISASGVFLTCVLEGTLLVPLQVALFPSYSFWICLFRHTAHKIIESIVFDEICEIMFITRSVGRRPTWGSLSLITIPTPSQILLNWFSDAQLSSLRMRVRAARKWIVGTNCLLSLFLRKYHVLGLLLLGTEVREDKLESTWGPAL